MIHNKTLVREDGESFPYSEKVDKDGYYYRVSICVNGRDAHLVITNWGTTLQFNDDASCLDYSVIPEQMYPAHDRLQPGQILAIMDNARKHLSDARQITKEQMANAYRKWLEEK